MSTRCILPTSMPLCNTKCMVFYTRVILWIPLLTIHFTYRTVVWYRCTSTVVSSVAFFLYIGLGLRINCLVSSGARTNLKVGWGAPIRRKAPEDKNIFGRTSPLFLALTVQLVVLASAFVMVSTVWSVSCLLFFNLRCPPCPAICKSGGTCLPWSMESTPLLVHCNQQYSKAVPKFFL